MESLKFLFQTKTEMIFLFLKHMSRSIKERMVQMRFHSLKMDIQISEEDSITDNLAVRVLQMFKDSQCSFAMMIMEV